MSAASVDKLHFSALRWDSVSDLILNENKTIMTYKVDRISVLK